MKCGWNGPWLTIRPASPSCWKSGDQKLSGTVASPDLATPTRRPRIGKLQLAAGAQRAVLRPTGQFATTLMNLREIKLVPAAAK